jgi:putative ABC transport system permease protein
MRHQPVIAWVTVLGTALSVFLILIVVMMQNVGIMNFAPESHRDRMLYGKYLHEVGINGSEVNQSSGIPLSLARKFYGDLDGVEQTSYFGMDLYSFDVKGLNDETFSARVRLCDAGFWRVFDHTLLAGRYFTSEEATAETRVAVLSQSIARRLFNSEDAVGKKFYCGHKIYTVVGIVKDSSMLATMASGEVFIPFLFSDPEYNNEKNEWGDVSVALLVKEGVDFEYIRDQVKKRYAEFDTELAPKGLKTVYHESPYDQATVASGFGGSNITPEHESDDILRICLYVILLIVPAINLSSMLHSRMTRRVSEIGVRRAYGCTRANIISDVITENMIVTLIGGVIGLFVAVLFALFYNGIFEADDLSVTPTLSMILNWHTIIATLIACLLLNLISAAIPAWHASRVNPVDAINSNHR